MNSEPPPLLPWAIDAQGLTKRFLHYRSTAGRLAEWLSFGALKRHQALAAVDDVSFRIAPGESVAILGENGAGKSTLLSLLLGTTRATVGHVAIGGEATGLMELGLGLKGDFTGRQNARLALMMRGIPAGRIEAENLIAEVAEFSELGQAFDWPMRTYSTGMQMRLAFAAATVIRPPILAVDEALAVGDAPFQFKCIGRIRAFKEAGTTLLFVSHDMAAMRSLCERGLLLSQGRLVADGPIDAVLDRYNALIAERQGMLRIAQEKLASGATRTRAGNGAVRIASHRLTDGAGADCRIFPAGGLARLELEIERPAEPGLPVPEALTLGFLIRNVLGLDVFGTNTLRRGLSLPDLAPGGRFRLVAELPLHLGPGRYFLTLAAHAGGQHVDGNYDWIDHALDFEVLADPTADAIGAAALPVRLSVEG